MKQIGQCFVFALAVIKIRKKSLDKILNIKCQYAEWYCNQPWGYRRQNDTKPVAVAGFTQFKIVKVYMSII